MPTLLFEQDWIRQISVASCDQVVTWKSCSDEGSSLQQCSGTQNRSLCVVRFLQPCPTIIPFYCCAQGRRCVLKDCCKILDNTVLPPETVVPPFTVFSGCPGRLQTDTRRPWLMLFFAYVAFPFSFLRPVFWWASRVHTGLDDWCNQELLSKVPASQSDLRHALKSAPTTRPSVWALTCPFFLCPRKTIKW